MSRLGSVLLMSVLWLSACGEGESGAGDGGPTVAEPNDATGVSCQDGATQSCSCTNGRVGAQSCTAGKWGQCICMVVTQPEASVPMTQERQCKAGYYTGTFEGEYWSGVFDLGFGSLFPVPVRAQATGSTPGLGLTLEEKRTAIGEEFSTYAVQDGCVMGNADAFGTSNPFVGVLTGELDCDTGEFKGSLKGYYNLLTTGIIYPFEGPVSAKYVDMELRNGMWDVKEHMMAENAPGGAGSWNVKWVGGVEEAPPLPPECLEIIDGNVGDGGGMTSADAGTGTPSADAGTGTTPPTDAGTGTAVDAGAGQAGSTP